MAKDENSMVWIAIILAAVALVVAFNSGSNEFIMQESEREVLSVSGNAELFAEPDEVEVHVRVQTQDMDALDAQEDNRVRSSDVMAALKKAGIREDDMETTQYNIQRVEKWNSREGESTFEGYRVVNVITVTTDRLDEIGDIIDAAVEAGANGIDTVEFGLSDDRMADLRNEALDKAASEARKKAESLADSLDVSLGDAVRISENNYEYIPYRSVMAEASMDAAGVPSTKVLPEDVRVQARVSVDFELR